jgi:hypothetical protein
MSPRAKGTAAKQLQAGLGPEDPGWWWWWGIQCTGLKSVHVHTSLAPQKHFFRKLHSCVPVIGEDIEVWPGFLAQLGSSRARIQE